MTNTSTTTAVIVIFLFAIQEAQLSRYFRQCLRNQSRASALQHPSHPVGSRESIRNSCRLYLSRRAAEKAIRDHSRIYRIRQILGLQEYLPHHHRLLNHGLED